MRYLTRARFALVVATGALFLVGCSADDSGLGDEPDAGSADQTLGTESDTDVFSDATQPTLGDAGPDTEGAPLTLEEITVDSTIAVGLESEGVEEGSNGDIVIRQMTADLDGDGFDDLISLDDAGVLSVRLFDRRRVRPPYSFALSPSRQVTNVTGGLAAGDFDGDGRTDVALVDQNNGEFEVLVNGGNGRLRPGVVVRSAGIKFEDLSFGFEDPSFGFEDPSFGFEDPSFGAQATWTVADMDGNGQSDIVAIRGTTIGVALFGPPSDSLASPFDVIVGVQSFEDPSFGFEGPPSAFAVANLDKDAGLEMLVGFANPETGSRIVAFEDPSFGFEDPSFGFEDPSFGFEDPSFGLESPLFAVSGVAHLPGTVRQIVPANLDGDEAADFLTRSHSADGTETIVGVWSTVGFEDPSFGFEDPSFGFEDPSFGYKATGARIGGEFGRIDATNTVLLPDGAGGSGPFAKTGQILLRGRGNAVVVTLQSPLPNIGQGFLAESFASYGPVVDLNKDGLAEFLGVDQELVVISQSELQTDAIPNLAGTDVCTERLPFCAGLGSLGVCAGAREICDQTCEFDTPEIGATFESDELSCDGLDNDCDGIVDVVSTRSLNIDFLGASSIDKTWVYPFQGGFKIVAVGPDGFYHGEMPDTGTTATIMPDDAAGMTNIGFATADINEEEVAVVVDDGVQLRYALADTVGTTPGVLSLGTPETGDLAHAGTRWWLVSGQGGTLNATSLEGVSVSVDVLTFAEPIEHIVAEGWDENLLVTVKTQSQRIFVLALRPTVANQIVLVDSWQLEPPAPGVTSTVALDAGGNLGCIGVVDRLGPNTRVTAHRVVLEAERITVEAAHTLSQASVDTGIDAAALTDGCQLAWVEALPGDDGQQALVQATLDGSGEVLVQTLREQTGLTRPDVVFADGASPRAAIAAVSDATTGTMTFEVEEVCP